ncbi:hypothetical protein GUJ93_ZPchr0011g27666 [Zizania palustris]|uniref:Uncharacterized protein n=1 Tax=Zizania palustris TaxID=103762 RepID=A0A8J5WIC0_ZIZPA|nr:hypothetical protein GUJ93_ZPchr0011g27666 [Zizania palustris]
MQDVAALMTAQGLLWEVEDFVREAGVLSHVELGAEVVELVPIVSESFEAASSEASDSCVGGVMLTDELCDGIVKQVEYYFSNEFLMKIVKKNKQCFDTQ